MLTLQENCKIIYIVLVESTHPNPIHYNNRLAKIIEVKFFYESRIIKSNTCLGIF
jgi:hypothetical protein